MSLLWLWNKRNKMFQMRDIWRLDINKAGSAIYLKAKITFVFIEELSKLQQRTVHVIFERVFTRCQTEIKSIFPILFQMNKNVVFHFCTLSKCSSVFLYLSTTRWHRQIDGIFFKQFHMKFALRHLFFHVFERRRSVRTACLRTRGYIVLYLYAFRVHTYFASGTRVSACNIMHYR